MKKKMKKKEEQGGGKGEGEGGEGGEREEICMKQWWEFLFNQGLEREGVVESGETKSLTGHPKAV